MKKLIILVVLICMLCTSMTGASIFVDKTNDSAQEEFPINKATESPEVNIQVLNNINSAVDKYLNFGDYVKGDPPRKTVKEIEFPWGAEPLPAGDFVEWIIEVNYNDKYFEQSIQINPTDFKDRFLEHPWHYEDVYFDVDEDGTNDLGVYYSIFISNVLNTQENIDLKSVRTLLKVDTTGIVDRTAKLEVWSKIKLNYGLIKTSKDRSSIFDGRVGSFIFKFLERLKERFENIGFAPFSKLINWINNRNKAYNDGSDIGVLADDSDYLSLGIGVGSPAGEIIPLYMTKSFNVAKDNIFSPMIFETELSQTSTKEPLDLLYGFRSFKAGSTTPTLDVAFGLEFDPAICIKTQFIPRNGYIYYGYDTGSANSQQTKVTFISDFIKGVGDNVELSLIFDSTTPLAQTNNWMSFDIHLFDIQENKIWGFDYKANKKFDIGLMVSSPVFSAKVKLVGIPDRISHWFDADLSLQWQQGQLFESTAECSLNLDMSSDLQDFIIYYPELSSDEPDIEFIKVSGIPKAHKLTAQSHLLVKNESYVTLLGEGYIDFTMSSNLGSIKAFYRKADPADPDKLFIDLPQGLPSSQRVGAKAQLYLNPNNFSDQNNYIFGRAYRTASGNIQEISGYLPGETEPIVRITQIPSNSEAEGKLIWGRLEGYAHAARYSPSAPDPIEINVDIGTFNLNNYLEIRDGNIDLSFHLAEQGYFKFDTANDMIDDAFQVTDTSTGNQLGIGVAKVNANDLYADWNLDTSTSPIQVEELAFGGDLNVLEDFAIEATLQGKYLNFGIDWHVGEEGDFSVDFNQDGPIELVVDDLFPDNPMYNLGGGVILSQDFHFDINWRWVQGTSLSDPGYLIINQDSTNPNFDWIGLTFTYVPEGYTTPQYGIEVGGSNVGVIIYMKWYKAEGQALPQVWWYVHIQGTFYLHLLWKGTWYPNVHLW